MTDYLDQVIHQRDQAREQLRAAENELGQLRQRGLREDRLRAAWQSARARAAERLAILADYQVEAEALRAKVAALEARIAAGHEGEEPAAGKCGPMCAERHTYEPGREQRLTVRYLANYRRVPVCPGCGDSAHVGITCEQAAQHLGQLREFWDRAVRQVLADTGGVKRGPMVAFSNEDAVDARLLAAGPAEAEVRARVREIIAPHFPGQRDSTTCPDWCAYGHMYDGSCRVDPVLDGVIGESGDQQHPGWYWSCEGGDGACFGWLSLDHVSAAAARRSYDRHLKREHAEASPSAEVSRSLGAQVDRMLGINVGAAFIEGPTEAAP